MGSMSTWTTGGMLLLLAAGGVRGEGNEDAEGQVILRVKTSGNISPFLLNPAKSHVSEILRTAGIRVRWEGAGSGRRQETGSCSGTVLEVIDVMILDHSPKNARPGALAYALPFARSGVRVVIYYDRVIAAVNTQNPAVLGYTIAHEVGHVLLGTDSHATSGVMLAHWRQGDYSRMETHALIFTAGDIDKMQRNVREQAVSCNDRAAGE
jgi:hypothetical protein